MDLDKLERLASLRDSGAITDAEFEAEKAKLLQQSQEYEPSSYETERPRWLGKFLGAGVIILLIGGAAAYLYANGFDPNPVVSRVSAGSSDSGWQFSTTTDPMNDQEIVTASRRIEAGDYYVKAQIRCANSTKLSYEFDIFRQDQSGDAIDSRVDLFALSLGSFGLRRSYELRLDSGEAKTATTDSRYSNVLSTDSSDSPGYGADDPQTMAKAQRIRIRVPMQHQDLTFEVPQREPDIRQFLHACHKVEPNADFVPSEQEKVPEAQPAQNSAAGAAAEEQAEPENAVQAEGNSDL
jgi:hypothetical protein